MENSTEGYGFRYKKSVQAPGRTHLLKVYKMVKIIDI